MPVVATIFVYPGRWSWHWMQSTPRRWVYFGQQPDWVAIAPLAEILARVPSPRQYMHMAFRLTQHSALPDKHIGFPIWRTVLCKRWKLEQLGSLWSQITQYGNINFSTDLENVQWSSHSGARRRHYILSTGTPWSALELRVLFMFKGERDLKVQSSKWQACF